MYISATQEMCPISAGALQVLIQIGMLFVKKKGALFAHKNVRPGAVTTTRGFIIRKKR